MVHVHEKISSVNNRSPLIISQDPYIRSITYRLRVAQPTLEDVTEYFLFNNQLNWLSVTAGGPVSPRGHM